MALDFFKWIDQTNLLDSLKLELLDMPSGEFNYFLYEVYNDLRYDRISKMMRTASYHNNFNVMLNGHLLFIDKEFIS